MTIYGVKCESLCSPCHRSHSFLSWGSLVAILHPFHFCLQNMSIHVNTIYPQTHVNWEGATAYYMDRPPPSLLPCRPLSSVYNPSNYSTGPPSPPLFCMHNHPSRNYNCECMYLQNVMTCTCIIMCSVPMPTTVTYCIQTIHASHCLLHVPTTQTSIYPWIGDHAECLNGIMFN